MKFLYLLLLIVFSLAGCAPHAELPGRQISKDKDLDGALYQIRIRQHGKTRFSGLIGLQQTAGGVESVLLDATGAPLIKGLVLPDGTMALDYAPEALQLKMIPELIGKLVKYIYFTPGTMDCSWYVLYQVCLEKRPAGKMMKQAKLGPVRLWQVQTTQQENESETIEVETLLPPLVITMDLVSQQMNP